MSEYSGFLPIISLIDLDNIYRESHCKSPANYARCMLRISYILSFKMRELASWTAYIEYNIHNLRIWHQSMQSCKLPAPKEE